MLTISGKILPDGSIAPGVLDGTIASVCGMQTLQMGVFGGIIVGLGVAALHNRYHKIVLPNALSFFGGSRSFPLSATVVYLGVGILMIFYLACGAERDLCTGRTGDRDWLCGYTDFWHHQTLP